MPLRLCPSCRSRKKLQNGGIETSVRPNPTLVFHVYSSNCLPPKPCPFCRSHRLVSNGGRMTSLRFNLTHFVGTTVPLFFVFCPVYDNHRLANHSSSPHRERLGNACSLICDPGFRRVGNKSVMCGAVNESSGVKSGVKTRIWRVFTFWSTRLARRSARLAVRSSGSHRCRKARTRSRGRPPSRSPP